MINSVSKVGGAQPCVFVDANQKIYRFMQNENPYI